MSSAAGLSKPFIRQLLAGDAQELAKEMRQEDREEVFLAAGSTPLQSIQAGIAHSRLLRIVELKGKAVGIFGVCGELGKVGVPWMLATPEIVNCKSLLRQTRQMVRQWSEDHPLLTNACWYRNTVHIEWIRWMGFTFEGSDIRNGETFLHFHRTTHV